MLQIVWTKLNGRKLYLCCTSLIDGLDAECLLVFVVIVVDEEHDLDDACAHARSEAQADVGSGASCHL